MAKRTQLTWIILLAFTVITGLISMASITYTIYLILVLSSLKFLGVAFEFMDLKSAHTFWKTSLLVFLFVFMGVILVLF